MPSLKDLKNRIGSVKNTQKITKAMKMVAAAKLKRATEQAEAGRPYAESLEKLLSNVAAASGSADTAPRLLIGSGEDKTHLLVVATSDRGLCGGFNATIVKAVRKEVRALQAAGKKVKLYCIGRKGAEQLKTEFGSLIVKKTSDVGKKRLSYSEAEEIAENIITMFDAGEFDVATVFYNRFVNAITQVVTKQQLIPLPVLESANDNTAQIETAPYEYEPGEEEILIELLPRNVGVQLYRALLENAASEQGARMSAMDSATRNAGEMIKKLTLQYNRTRQAAITKELIEIISGAEAV